ncbi:MAG: hypothetical protein LLF75_04555 [Eubacteriales bacterium]|nr:hypothetical protein [Eubacteriales bacterium]
MKFYVASGVPNAERVNKVARVLTANGHERTYDWTRHGDVSAESPARKREVAQTESQAVIDAQLVVLLLPGRFGTHAELGTAIASSANKRILLWSESSAPFDGTEGFCVFYHHPAVERFVGPFDEFLHYLSAL